MAAAVVHRYTLRLYLSTGAALWNGARRQGVRLRAGEGLPLLHCLFLLRWDGERIRAGSSGSAVAEGGLAGGGDVHIDVASVPGRGSHFTIMLPSISEQREPVARANAARLADSLAEANAGTVLVVEDEEPLRLAVSKDAS